ncbi:PPE domain-containing protein [Actinophytocola sp.]|uniref:PPE domain-containing protein n=1 Tax=Actinophytocola sp. TaxID=1872138 RepID=UPI00389A74C1
MNGRHNWDGYSHRELYDRIHGKGGFFLPDGAGVSGATGAQDGWRELADVMAHARERTEAALARAGAVWEGAAADAMRAGVTPLAQWADDVHTASLASQASTDTHVSAYSAAKNTMPEPVPVTSTANGDFGGIPAGFTHLFGGQTDQDKQEAAAQEAKAEAVRVMDGYDVASGVARTGIGRFVPPPSVTVDVAPPRPKGGDVIPGGVSEWPGPGPRVDDGTPEPGDCRSPGATQPGSTPAPGPGTGDASGSRGTTTPSTVGTRPSSVGLPPAEGPPTTGLRVDQYRSGSLPVLPGIGTGGTGTGGAPGESAADGGGRSSAGRGNGGRGSDAGRGGRTAGVGGGLPEERTAGRGGTGAAGTRAGGMGVGPAGHRAEGDDDKEHRTAEYLVSSHDGFWDDNPPVAPSVIGDEEDDG